METAPREFQLHQTSEQKDLLFPGFSPLKSLPLLVPTSAPRGPQGKDTFPVKEAVLGALLRIPTAPSAPHPPSKVRPLFPAFPFPKISHLGAGASSQQALWARGAATAVPQTSCQALGATWRWLLGWHMLTSPLLCSSQIPLYQPPWTSSFLGERGQGGQLAAAAPQELGAAGAPSLWAQGQQLHLGWVCAARHQPGLEAGGDTEDRQLLPGVSPDPPEAPTAPQGCPAAGTGTSVGTRAVPCPPAAAPAASSTAWVWGLVNSDPLCPCP